MRIIETAQDKLRDALVALRDLYIQDYEDENKMENTDEETIKINNEAIRNLETMQEKDFDWIETKVFECFEQIMNGSS